MDRKETERVWNMNGWERSKILSSGCEPGHEILVNVSIAAIADRWFSLHSRETLSISIGFIHNKGAYWLGAPFLWIKLIFSINSMLRTCTKGKYVLLGKTLDFLRKLKYNHIRKIREKGKREPSPNFPKGKKRTVP